MQNHVGRPSNEELKMRRNKKIVMIALPVVIVLAIVFFITSGNFSSLMGNSVTSYYCLENASYVDNKCVREIKEPAYFIGDVDKSGDITIQDATMLQTYINKTYLLDSQQLLLADCNGDGLINSEDVTLIQQFVANIGSSQNDGSGKSSLVNSKKVCAASYELKGGECVRKISTEPLIKDKFKDAKYAYYLGDINKDDIIDGKDYLYLKNYLTNSSDYTLDTEQLIVADLNMDSKIDNIDLDLLIKYLATKTSDSIWKTRLCISGFELNNSYCVVLDKEQPPTKIVLDQTEGELGVDEKMKIAFRLEPDNVDQENVTFSSSDESIATVSASGEVTAKKVGKVTITVKITDKIKATYRLNVISKIDAFCNQLVQAGATSLDYKVFIEKLNRYDDYYGIKATHDCANKHKLPVVVSKGTYNIYKLNDESIKVETNTDLGGSDIYIHDENGAVTNTIEKEKDGETIVKNVKDIPIYRMDNDKLTGDDAPSQITNVYYNKIIPELVGKGYSLVVIENNDKKVYIRSGKNANQGDNAKEAFRIDNSGKVLDKMFWNYYYNNANHISSVTVYPINENNLEFKNGNFFTIVDTEDRSDVKDYVKRGILVKRSNTTVNNINHAYVKKDGNSYKNIRELTYRYNGFYRFAGVADITFTDSTVYAVNGKASETGESFYDFMMDDVVNATIDGVKMYDYQDNDAYFNSSSNQLNDNSWGVNGTNRCKEITFNNCVLNRIDAHRGIYNLTVKNSTMGKYGIHVIGAGLLNIDNVKTMYTNEFVVLRPDYGSTWNGKVKVTNSEIVPFNNDNVYLIKFTVTYDEKGNNKGKVHNYGYDLYLPKVSIDTLQVSSNASKFAIYRNTNYSTNNKNLKIYANGKLSVIKNNYIKNNSFSYNYPDPNKYEDINFKNVVGKNKSMKVYKFEKKIN